MFAAEIKRLRKDLDAEVVIRPCEEAFDDCLMVLTACNEEMKKSKQPVTRFDEDGFDCDAATDAELSIFLDDCRPDESSPRKVGGFPFWLLVPVILAVIKRILKKSTK